MTDAHRPSEARGSTETRPESRSLTLEREVAATPEELWDALTTPEGLRRWFPLDAKVTPGTSGSVWLSWGPGCEGEAPIHIWEPNRRFGWTEAYGEDEDGRPIKVAVDFHIEEHEGSTVLRLVQSGFSASSDWDETYYALKDGWAYFLFNLVFLFKNHRDQTRDLVWRRVPTDLTREDLWERLVSGSLIGPTEGSHDPTPTSGVEAADLLIDRHRPATVVSSRRGHHFAATLPDLGHSVLFVELEGQHVGLWLSTYGMNARRVDELQAALDSRVEAIFG